MTNRETFMTSMVMLGAVFGRVLAPEAVEGYWLALEDLDADDFAQATRDALRGCKFMPAPAELRTFARAYELARQKAERHAASVKTLADIEAKYAALAAAKS